MQSAFLLIIKKSSYLEGFFSALPFGQALFLLYAQILTKIDYSPVWELNEKVINYIFDAERYQKGDLPLANLLSKYCSYIVVGNRDL